MLFLTMRDRPLVAGAPIPDDLLAFGIHIQYADGRVAADTATSLSLPMTRIRSGHCFSLRAVAAAGASPR